ncbi:MAG TPA: NAD(P)H-dependent oxidoreductase subunit E [Solirubrobacterales bacterium]|nr:NAD(P)H-dependent oxidoreductase subunit E [Solirubrobacterales bacterium]
MSLDPLSFRQPAHLTEPTDELTAEERRELIASMRPQDAEGVPELHEVDIPPELREEIESAMARYPQLRSAAIPALWAVQRHYGWCSPEGLRQAAAVMGVTPAYLQSVASFYDLFATAPIGRHRVLVCHNISCWMQGGDELLASFCDATGADGHDADHHGATSPDGEFFVKGFECLGACDLAPVASIDQRYYGPLDATDALAAVEALRRGDDPVPEKALAKRPAAGGAEPEPDPRVAEAEKGTDA